MSNAKLPTSEPSNHPRHFPRRLAGLVVILLGAAASLHLYAHHVAHWWLPFVLLLLAHGAIISAVVWLLARHHRGSMSDAHACEHAHEPASLLLHTPRFYDWLVWFLALGRERKFRERILDLAELRTGDAILDVGCGTGTLLRQGARRIGPTGSAQGVEASPEMVAYARHQAQAEQLPVDFIQGSADQLPFPDGTFDVVFCTLVLHHLPAAMQNAALREMCRVLRREGGGRLVLVDMARPPKLAAALSLVTLFHRARAHHAPPDWAAIEQLLKDQGLQSLEVHRIWGGTLRIVVARSAVRAVASA